MTHWCTEWLEFRVNGTCKLSLVLDTVNHLYLLDSACGNEANIGLQKYTSRQHFQCRKMIIRSEKMLLLAVMLIHLLVCPYTKVEESFNMQAVHDVIYYGTDINSYDHLEFPGVVPRTFIGPLVVATVSSPAVSMAMVLGLNKFLSQYIVRFFLGLLVLFGLFSFADAVEKQFGRKMVRWFYFITASQFHFIFYMSRTLPNIFALVLVLFALSSWLNQKHGFFLWSAGAAIVIFRSELVLYLGIILLMELISGKLSLAVCIKHVIPAGIVLLGGTVFIDSIFWKRWLWPEGEVLWYNTILNKSSQWGTEPFLWYFYSVLPRALLFSIFLVPLGIYFQPRLKALVVPAVTFVFLYSVLPHKELRFIIYVFPVLNVAAAGAINYLDMNKSKSSFKRFTAFLAIMHILGNCACTGVFLYISHFNYPGGFAMSQFHNVVPHKQVVNVHIDVAAAQTGVTRFTQLNDKWIYNKTEDLVPGSEALLKYSHLILAADKKAEIYHDTHKALTTIDGYDGIGLSLKSFPPFFIKKSPKIIILQRNKL